MNLKSKRLASILAAGVLALSLSACTQETFTYEGDPVGNDDDPTKVECFTIEADSSSGDGKDRQLGEFCKESKPSKEAQDQMDDEENDD